MLTLTRDNVTPTLREFSRVMRRDLPEVVREAFKRTTREVIAITPPASAGMVGRDAYNQGRSKIARQMSSILAPVTLKGRRVIRIVFGRVISTPVTVKTTERYPDVRALYRKETRLSSAQTGIRVRNPGAKFYVDRRKMQAELKRKFLAVGRLAAGWNAAANAAGVAVPAWIRRHGAAGGSLNAQLTGDKLVMRATNFAPQLPAPLRGELRRRLPYAMRYALNGMRRNIAAVTAKSARTAKIPTVRIPAGSSLLT